MSSVDIGPEDVARPRRLADLDGDGDLDIVSIGWGRCRVIVYENLAGGAGL